MIHTDIKSFANSIKKELADLKRELNGSMQDLAKNISDVVVEEVLNKDNWNDEARYKVGPHTGSKYDGQFSGQLFDNIRNNVSIVFTKNGFKIGIGNISLLDAMGTKSESSTTSYSKSFPYWRSFVYGRRPSLTHSFKWDGVSFYSFGDSKPYGKIIPGGKMRGQKGTYMFHKGLHASRSKVSDLVYKYLADVSRRVKTRWR